MRNSTGLKAGSQQSGGFASLCVCVCVYTLLYQNAIQHSRPWQTPKLRFVYVPIRALNKSLNKDRLLLKFEYCERAVPLYG